MSTPAPQRTTYILGIYLDDLTQPYLLVRGLGSQEEVFRHNFNGILPDAESGWEAISFEDYEAATAHIHNGRKKNKSWTYALWIPDGAIPTPSPAEGTTYVLGFYGDNPEYQHFYPGQPNILERHLEANDDFFGSFKGIIQDEESGTPARAFASPEDALAYIKDAKENHGSDWTYALWIPPQPQA